jgi:hypothetical protein
MGRSAHAKPIRTLDEMVSCGRATSRQAPFPNLRPARLAKVDS